MQVYKQETTKDVCQQWTETHTTIDNCNQSEFCPIINRFTSVRTIKD